jgi:hypothetical protein
MTDAIFEAEWFLLIGQNVTILPPYCLDSSQLLIGFPGAIKSGLQALRIGRDRGDYYVDLVRSEGLFPMLWAVVAHIPQQLRARRHSLLELWRKAIE